jgi:uncharacterized membrane protein (UPF0127 family)
MFGLDFALDLIFLNKNGDVVSTIEELQPRKRTSRVEDARFALELPTGVIAASYTQVGDRLAWTSPEPDFSPPPRMDDLSRFDLGRRIHPSDQMH